MPPRAGSGGRATLDFFAAQASARRRTAALAFAFALALVAVILLVYLALLIAAGTSGAGMVDVGADGAVYGPSPFQPALLAAAAVGVAAVTGVGTAYHAVRLSAGGGAAVAELLGGSPVDRATQDPAERRLVNVAEEMALAAGMPVPRLYVLKGEAGLNAFAAGYTPGHSVVAVTRGALDRLTRDELQGVVAHELSHVLNADTRIDLRLMAAVGGLTFLSLLGRLLLDGTPRVGRSRDRNRGALLLVGLGLLVAGAFGSLCGKLVRYAVARQREWLADASAVQFTRNPDGLASALRKIAREGSAVASPTSRRRPTSSSRATTGFLAGLFSTHPPMEERIRRLAPHLGALPGAGGAAAVPGPPGPAAPRTAAPGRSRARRLRARPRAGRRRRPPRRSARPTHPRRPTPRRAPRAAPGARRRSTSAARRRCSPGSRRRSVRPPEPFGAAPSPAPCWCGRRRGAGGRSSGSSPGADRARRRGRAAPARARRLSRADHTGVLGPRTATPRPALAGQATALEADLRASARPTEPWRLRARGAPRGGAATPPRRRRRRARSLRTIDGRLPGVPRAALDLAWIGGRDAAAAQAALDAGAGARRRRPLAPPPRERLGLGRLDATLERLDGARAVKARLLEAAALTALADGLVTLGRGRAAPRGGRGAGAAGAAAPRSSGRPGALSRERSNAAAPPPWTPRSPRPAAPAGPRATRLSTLGGAEALPRMTPGGQEVGGPPQTAPKGVVPLATMRYLLVPSSPGASASGTKTPSEDGEPLR